MRFSFFSISFFLLSGFVGINILSYTPQHNDDIHKLNHITKVFHLALSTKFLEENLYEKVAQNRLYPQMKVYNKMDFVYAK